MDKIKKFLKKLPEKQLRQILSVINKMEKGDFKGLDVKKLTGYKDIFRVRSRDIRLLFLREDQGYRLISVEYRSDKTYNL